MIEALSIGFFVVSAILSGACVLYVGIRMLMRK